MQKRLLFLLWTLFASVVVLRAQLPQKGYASYYADKFHGRKTASGERYYKDSFVAAHRTLPFGTKVRVTNEKSGATVVVRIIDRGPYSKGRVIDLSKAAAKQMGLIGVGVMYVTVEAYESKGEEPIIFADGSREPLNASFVVQTGVFREEGNATNFKDSLHTVGFTTFTIDTVRVKQQELYRVSAGPFTRKDEAEELVKKLKAQDFDSYVIRL